MIIRVDAAGAVRLDEPGDLRRFSVALADTAAARAGLAAMARMDGQTHAWIAPERIRALAGPQPAGWDQQFDATIAYAAGKGWTDDDGALRAHVVVE